MLRTALTILIAAAVFTYGCSDGGDDSGSVESIPTYTGAAPVEDDVISETGAFSGTWITPDDVPAVRSYFERELADGGDWRVVETREIDDGVVIRIDDPNDESKVGTIIVRREGDSTRIVKTTGGGGEDDGEDDGSSDEVSDGLPEGYPSDVPLPPDAENVSGSAPRVGTSQYYLVQFTTSSPPADVIAHFNEALPAQGWEAGAAGTDPAGFALRFNRGDDTVLVTGGAAGDGTDASITITLED